MIKHSDRCSAAWSTQGRSTELPAVVWSCIQSYLLLSEYLTLILPLSRLFSSPSSVQSHHLHYHLSFLLFSNEFAAKRVPETITSAFKSRLIHLSHFNYRAIALKDQTSNQVIKSMLTDVLSSKSCLNQFTVMESCNPSQLTNSITNHALNLLQCLSPANDSLSQSLTTLTIILRCRSASTNIIVSAIDEHQINYRQLQHIPLHFWSCVSQLTSLKTLVVGGFVMRRDVMKQLLNACSNLENLVIFDGSAERHILRPLFSSSVLPNLQRLQVHCDLEVITELTSCEIRRPLTTLITSCHTRISCANAALIHTLTALDLQIKKKSIAAISEWPLLALPLMRYFKVVVEKDAILPEMRSFIEFIANKQLSLLHLDFPVTSIVDGNFIGTRISTLESCTLRLNGVFSSWWNIDCSRTNNVLKKLSLNSLFINECTLSNLLKHAPRLVELSLELQCKNHQISIQRCLSLVDEHCSNLRTLILNAWQSVDVFSLPAQYDRFSNEPRVSRLKFLRFLQPLSSASLFKLLQWMKSCQIEPLRLDIASPSLFDLYLILRVLPSVHGVLLSASLIEQDTACVIANLPRASTATHNYYRNQQRDQYFYHLNCLKSDTIFDSETQFLISDHHRNVIERDTLLALLEHSLSEKEREDLERWNFNQFASHELHRACLLDTLRVDFSTKEMLNVSNLINLEELIDEM